MNLDKTGHPFLKHPHVLPSPVIHGFFIIGVLSAVAFRLIIVLQHMEPLWVRPTWYAGVIGYILFFLYRYYISRKRKKAIRDFDLIEKLKANACLSEDDRDVTIYLLSSIMKSREDMNYFIVFILSIVAITADILLTSIK
ncbi:MAG: hypothetical protein AB1499_15425 [Nitrospirota bacterium]